MSQIMRRRDGLSIVETMVAMSILIFLISGISKYIVFQSKIISELSAKQDLDGLEREINFLLQDPTVCKQNFEGMTVHTGQMNNPNYTIPTTQILPSNVTGAEPVVQLGAKVPNLPSSLLVENLYLDNLRPGGGNRFSADLVMLFNQDTIKVPPAVVKNIRFQGTALSSNPNLLSISGCSVLNGGSLGAAANCTTTIHDHDQVGALSVYCQPGQTLGASGVACTLEDTPGSNEWVEDPQQLTGENLRPEVHINRPDQSPSGEVGWRGDCYGPGTQNLSRVRVYLTCCD